MKWKVTHYSRQSLFALGRYNLIYRENTIVRAVPGSIGIMLFDTYMNARMYAARYWDNYEILQVETFGEGIRPDYIAGTSHEPGLDSFYKTGDYSSKNRRVPPIGTICYMKIRVLD